MDRLLGRTGHQSAFVEQALRKYIVLKERKIQETMDLEIINRQAESLNNEATGRTDLSGGCMRRGEFYRVYKGSRQDPKSYRVFVIASRQTVIDSRFSTAICALIFLHMTVCLPRFLWASMKA